MDRSEKHFSSDLYSLRPALLRVVLADAQWRGVSVVVGVSQGARLAVFRHLGKRGVSTKSAKRRFKVNADFRAIFETTGAREYLKGAIVLPPLA